MILTSTHPLSTVPLKETDIRSGLLVVGKDTHKVAILARVGNTINAIYLDSGRVFQMLSASDVVREFYLMCEPSVIIMIQPLIS